MGSDFVVFRQPPVGGFLDIFQPDEQALIQPLVAQRPVEPLDVGVLVWLAMPYVLDHCPLRERFSQELRAVVQKGNSMGLRI
jgi:hypothetical protein